MPMIVAAGFWAFIDLAGMFYPSDIANAAHLFGLVSGVIIGLALRKRFFLRPEPKSKVLDEEEIDRWEDEYMK
jgi:membrane associated rhomboid family serine protease